MSEGVHANKKEDMLLRMLSGLSLTTVVLLAFHAGRLENRVSNLEKLVQAITEHNVTIAKIETTQTEMKQSLEEVKRLLREHELEAKRRLSQ